MAQYTRLEPDDIRLIVEKHGLGPVEAFESLAGGQANSSFLATTPAGRFVTSICDEKSGEEVERTAALLRLLEEKNFPATRVVPTVDGRLTSEFGGRPVLIKHYLEGAAPEELTPNMLRALGRALAELHRIDPPPELPRGFAYGLESFDEVIDSGAEAEFRSWLGEVKNQVQENLDPSLPRGLVHGDVFFDNTLFDGEDLVAVIDFEEACNYYFVFDLGMCAIGSGLTGGEVDPDKIRALVQGYESLRRLDPGERERLQIFSVYGAAATAFWRFRQYNLIHPGHPLQDSFLEMKKAAESLRSISAEDFQAKVF